MNALQQPAFSSDTEYELVQSAAAIGNIAEMAAWATAELAGRIDRAGKPVGQLTVAELLALCSDNMRSSRCGGAPC